VPDASPALLGNETEAVRERRRAAVLRALNAPYAAENSTPPPEDGQLPTPRG
jgi:hypothetical protein